MRIFEGLLNLVTRYPNLDEILVETYVQGQRNCFNEHEVVEHLKRLIN